MQTTILIKYTNLFKLLIFTFSLFGFVSVYAQSESNYQRSINNISKEIRNLSRNINANKSKFEVEQTKLLKAERELVEISSKLSAARTEVKQSLALIKELEEKQSKLVSEQTQSRKVLRALIASNHKNGVPSQIKMLMNQENPYGVGRLSNYQTYFSSAITRRFHQLEQEVEAGRVLRNIQKIRIAELQNLEQEQQFLKKDKIKKNEARRQALERLDKKVAADESKLKKLTADRQRLNRLLEQLEKQKADLARIERERAKAERLAAEKVKKQDKSIAKRVIRKPVKGGFLKQKKRLSCPVEFTAKTLFGERIVSSGMKSEGMFYDTKKSVPVKSIFRGQVLFADFLKGFGLLLIVDHGDDHISLYGHNEVLYKKVGDPVSTNEVISKTGITGGLRSPGLYFEIRKSTSPINPMKWCQ